MYLCLEHCSLIKMSQPLFKEFICAWWQQLDIAITLWSKSQNLKTKVFFFVAHYSVIWVKLISSLLDYLFTGCCFFVYFVFLFGIVKIYIKVLDRKPPIHFTNIWN